MTRPRLLALDLDGTLLRRDQRIAPRDEGAIRAVVRSGIHVAICTGRVSTGAVATARRLGLQTSMICADGGVFACPSTAKKRWQNPIRLQAAEYVASVAEQHGMASFVCLPDVKKHATDELRATSDEGGGVAEAIERWLR